MPSIAVNCEFIKENGLMKMKFKRSLIILICSLCIAVIVSACGQGDAAQATESGSEAEVIIQDGSSVIDTRKFSMPVPEGWGTFSADDMNEVTLFNNSGDYIEVSLLDKPLDVVDDEIAILKITLSDSFEKEVVINGIECLAFEGVDSSVAGDIKKTYIYYPINSRCTFAIVSSLGVDDKEITEIISGITLNETGADDAE